jgi:hypothetical protein
MLWLLAGCHQAIPPRIDASTGACGRFQDAPSDWTEYVVADLGVSLRMAPGYQLRGRLQSFGTQQYTFTKAQDPRWTFRLVAREQSASDSNVVLKNVEECTMLLPAGRAVVRRHRHGQAALNGQMVHPYILEVRIARDSAVAWWFLGTSADSIGAIEQTQMVASIRRHP